MNKYLEALQGLNLVALRRGFEEGPRALDRASRLAYIAARAWSREICVGMAGAGKKLFALKDEPLALEVIGRPFRHCCE